MGSDPAALLDNLREATSRLASPPDDQIDYVRALGTAPMVDELGLEFDDAYGTVPELKDQGVLGSEAARALDRVDEALAAIGDDEWSEQAVRQSGTWQRVRERASEATRLLS